MADWLYQYPPLLAGTLIKRYKRFLADIELDTGEVVTAHCPNTGPMTGMCAPHSRVQISQSNNPKRKLAYTWEMIEVCDTEPTWVGVNTQIPNLVVKQLLQNRLLPTLGEYDQVKSEVRYGREKSRIDFLLTGTAQPAYIEVKSTTWAIEKQALFPDTVTIRGQKHIRELISVLPAAQAYLLFFINRADCTTFAPGDQADPEYGKLLREAVATGVGLLPCRFEITPEGIRYLGLATVEESSLTR
ncbi:DNA/RNA nuclease SfsA [Acaryochloris marina]|uniref:Sugar fermentation stimulation protein homolog n=1 Tax=Acaryochloris marina (strain MBIC 11017) TaxID=329726 RepID=SFSA_ACAM1|nr:DNA/RNA nuclease SfsA [Acaryochloris marina]B0C250.1 RecName: Full=Sugar fermentation stimulation protein homolog [Acaryochloris marina MBIC11017]ABW27351.1 sugar fermentation stimulation protein [Acaryochloris marina MBIC11017]